MEEETCLKQALLLDLNTPALSLSLSLSPSTSVFHRFVLFFFVFSGFRVVTQPGKSVNPPDQKSEVNE